MLLLSFCCLSAFSLEKVKIDFNQVKPFVEKYCYDCHGDGVDKGGFDFDKLGKDLSDPAIFFKWEQVLERAISGEMPPKKKKKRPSSKDLESFEHHLSPSLFRVHSAKKGTILRRLNNQEYENTLNDVFGTNLKIAEQLPEDGRSHEFDTVGKALGISMAQMQKYIEVARFVVDESIAEWSTAPKAETKTVSFLDSKSDVKKFIGEVWKKLPDNSVVRFEKLGYPSGKIGSSRIRKPGLYSIQVNGYAHQSDIPVRFSVSASKHDKGSTPRVFGYYSFPPEKSSIEISAYLYDGEMITIEPYGIKDKERNERKKNKTPIEAYKGPGLAITNVVMNGPLYSDYPSPGHKLLFTGVKRIEQEPGNPKDKKKSWYRPKFKVEVSDEAAAARLALNTLSKKLIRKDSVKLDPYMSLFQQERKLGETYEESLKTAVVALLSSTDFLYFHEKQGALSSLAIAGRLSYFLNRTVPDEHLKKADLTKEKERNKQFERLMKDEKFERFITDFTDAWLNLREMDFTAPDKRLFPEYDEYLRYSMPLETTEFLRTMIQENLPIKNFIKSDFLLLNDRLASHYGISGVNGTKFRKVTLPQDSLRGGLLTQSSILKVSANGTNSSPVVRGIWVMERLLGKEPPPPPPGVPGVEPDTRGATTLRELLAKHSSLQSCQGCHSRIDPLGFALEEFNPIGGHRTYYRATAGKGKKISGTRYRIGPDVDSSGEMPDGASFKGYKGFRDYMVTKPDLLAEAFVGKLLTFSTGRNMGFSDEPEIKAIVKEASKKGYRVKDIFKLVINSRIFLSK